MTFVEIVLSTVLKYTKVYWKLFQDTGGRLKRILQIFYPHADGSDRKEASSINLHLFRILTSIASRNKA